MKHFHNNNNTTTNHYDAAPTLSHAEIAEKSVRVVDIDPGLEEALEHFDKAFPAQHRADLWDEDLVISKPFANTNHYDITSGTEYAKSNEMRDLVNLQNLVHQLYLHAVQKINSYLTRGFTCNHWAYRVCPPVSYLYKIPIAGKHGSISILHHGCMRTLRMQLWGPGTNNEWLTPRTIDERIAVPSNPNFSIPPVGSKAYKAYQEEKINERDDDSIRLRSFFMLVTLKPTEIVSAFLHGHTFNKLDPSLTYHSQAAPRTASNDEKGSRFFNEFIELRRSSVLNNLARILGLGTESKYLKINDPFINPLTRVFSVHNALCLFYQQVCDYCALLDHQGKRLVNGIHFLMNLYYPETPAPSDAMIRLVSNKYGKLRRAGDSQFDPVLCADILSQLKEHQKVYKQQWTQCQQKVSYDTIKEEGRYPDWTRVTKEFYPMETCFFGGDTRRHWRWKDPNPRPLSEYLLEDRKLEYGRLQAELKMRPEAKNYKNDPQAFEIYRDILQRKIYQWVELLSIIYPSNCYDAQRLYERSRQFITPPNGWFIFPFHSCHGSLSFADDLLAVIVERLKKIGIATTAIEVSRVLELVLRSGGTRPGEDVIGINTEGDKGAGKTWLLNYICTVLLEGPLDLITSKTRGGQIYKINRMCFPEVSDEDGFNEDNAVINLSDPIKAAYEIYYRRGNGAPNSNRKMTATSKSGSNQTQARQMAGEVDEGKIGPVRQTQCCSVPPISTSNFPNAVVDSATGDRRLPIGMPNETALNPSSQISNSLAVQAYDRSGFDKDMRTYFNMFLLCDHLRICGLEQLKALFSTTLVGTIIRGFTDNSGSDVVEEKFKRTNAQSQPEDYYAAQVNQFNKNFSELEMKPRQWTHRNIDAQMVYIQNETIDLCQRLSTGLGACGFRYANSDGGAAIQRRMVRNINNYQEDTSYRSTLLYLMSNAYGMDFENYRFVELMTNVVFPRALPLESIKGLQTYSRLFDVRSTTALISILAMVLHEIRVNPNTVLFNKETGYLELKNFFTDSVTVLEEGKVSGGRGRGGEGVEETKTRRVPMAVANMFRVVHFNNKCSRAFPISLFSAYDMSLYRSLFSTYGPVRTPTFCAFMPYDPFITSRKVDLYIHFTMFSLPQIINRTINNILCASSQVETLLTLSPQLYLTDDGKIMREHEIVYFLTRQCDRSEFKDTSAYAKPGQPLFYPREDTATDVNPAKRKNTSFPDLDPIKLGSKVSKAVEINSQHLAPDNMSLRIDLSRPPLPPPPPPFFSIPPPPPPIPVTRPLSVSPPLVGNASSSSSSSSRLHRTQSQEMKQLQQEVDGLSLMIRVNDATQEEDEAAFMLQLEEEERKEKQREAENRALEIDYGDGGDLMDHYEDGDEEENEDDRERRIREEEEEAPEELPPPPPKPKKTTKPVVFPAKEVLDKIKRTELMNQIFTEIESKLKDCNAETLKHFHQFLKDRQVSGRVESIHHSMTPDFHRALELYKKVEPHVDLASREMLTAFLAKVDQERTRASAAQPSSDQSNPEWAKTFEQRVQSYPLNHMCPVSLSKTGEPTFHVVREVTQPNQMFLVPAVCSQRGDDKNNYLAMADLGSSTIYSRSKLLQENGILLDLDILYQEEQEIRQSILGEHHVWHPSNPVVEKHLHMIMYRIVELKRWLEPLFEYKSCRRESDTDRLYFMRPMPPSDEELKVMGTELQFEQVEKLVWRPRSVYAEEFRSILLTAFLYFFELMMFKTKLKGQFAPAISKGTVEYQAIQLGLDRVRGGVLIVAEHIYLPQTINQIRQEVTRKLGAYVNKLICETGESRRQRLSQIGPDKLDNRLRVLGVGGVGVYELMMVPEVADCPLTPEELTALYVPVSRITPFSPQPMALAEPPLLEHAREEKVQELFSPAKVRELSREFEKALTTPRYSLEETQARYQALYDYLTLHHKSHEKETALWQQYRTLKESQPPM